MRPYWNDSLCVLLEFDENMNLSYQVKNIRYNSLKIDFCNDSEIRKHVEDCLSYLSDDALYMSKVNQAVIELMSLYDSLFKMGNNAVKCDRSIKSFFRFFKRSLFHKEEPEHLLNILRCESHRWGVQRAMKILYDLN